MSRIVIIGASHSGITLADLLRKSGYKEEILIFEQSMEFPFERPPLSKSFISNIHIENYKPNLIRGLDWYKANNILLKLGIKVKKIKTRENIISLEDGSEIKFTKLVIATGASPNLLPKEICKSNNALVLRNFEDAKQILNAIKKIGSVQIIGGGYIGLELASSLVKIGCKVSLIEIADRLLSRVASKETSQYFYDLHRNNGVEIILNSKIINISEINDKFITKLDNNYEIISNKLLLGIGVKPEVNIAKSASINCKDGVVVDSFCRTNIKNIYAIGDCCFIEKENGLRIESIHNAHYTASKACASILGLELPKYEAPWFWSDQFDIKFKSVGLLPKVYTTITKKGKKEGSKSFWSFEGENFKCIETINDPQSFMVAKQILQDKSIKLSKEKLINPEFNLKSILNNQR